MVSPWAKPRPPFYSLLAYAAHRPAVVSPALLTTLVPNLMHKEHQLYCLLPPHLHASRNAVCQPGMLPTTSYLNLPGACLPLCYIDPELHPELLNWSLELKPGKVLQAILNAVGFHLSLRVMDLSNTKEEEHPQCLSPDPIQGNMDGFPDILASLTGVTQMTVLHCKQRTGTRPKLSLSSRGRTHTFTLVLSGQVASDSLQPHGLQPARLPCPQYCPSKNTGIGYHFLLQDTHRSLTEMPQQVSIDHFDLAGFLGKNTTLRVGSSTRITLHPPSLPRLP